MASEEPLPSELPPPSTTASNNSIHICDICRQPLTDGQDCLIINECSHPFHRTCIEVHLATSTECPVCKRVCDLSELRTYSLASKPPPAPKAANFRGKGRGAMSKHYNTRSVSKNLFQDNTNPPCPQTETLQTPRRNQDVSLTFSTTSPNNNNNSNNIPIAGNVDYNELNKIIENQLNKFFQNLNFPQPSTAPTLPPAQHIPAHIANPLQHTVNPNRTPKNNVCPSNYAFMNAQNFNNNLPENCYPQNPPINRYSPAANTSPNVAGNFNVIDRNADKITSIINNWNLKFDGSSTGLSIEEFLYRVNTLTKETFNNDFSIICRNLNILLTGKAREWYWRYHKTVPVIRWEDFCSEIRSQYKVMKSSFDLKEEMRNRKQKSGESYDSFFDSLQTIADRLSIPMNEAEFIEIIVRNLRPDIRQDLLYVPIRSLSHLRKLVQMRENFLNDEYVRRTLVPRNQVMGFHQRKQVAEVEEEIDEPGLDPMVNAVHKSESTFKCWNCDNNGHSWQDCLEDRTIFCYGCGTKNVYKPQCPKCLSRTSTLSKNYRQMGPQKDQA